MSPKTVEVHGKTFSVFITKDEIRTRVMELGREISKDYRGKNPIFVALLNGAFMFAADLVRMCSFDSELMFVGVSSYKGMQSLGDITINYGLNADLLKGRDIIVIEDIIDTGTTISKFEESVAKFEPASFKVAALLLKPNTVRFDIPMDYIGYRIPDEFVIGYGLDYDGLGRTLPDLYQLAEEEE